MRSRSLFQSVPWLLGGILILPAAPRGQQPVNAPPPPPSPAGEQVWYTLGRVVTFAGAPVLGAKVAIYLDSQAVPIHKFETSYNGEFDISLKIPLNQGHRAKVLATKAGFIRGMEVVDLASENKMDALDVVLREDNEDSDQLPFPTLISSVTGRLASASGGTADEPEKREALRRAKDLFESRDSEGALTFVSSLMQREPKSVEYRTLLALAMFESGSWSGGTRLLTETASFDPPPGSGSRRPEPEFILGVLECWRGNPDKGTERFLKALEIDSSYSLLLQELGRAYLLQQNWPRADESLAQAIEAGAPPEAHLMRAEALLAEAKPDSAQTEMQALLGGKKPRDLPLPVRMSWMKLEDRMAIERQFAASGSKTVVQQIPEELLRMEPDLQGVEFAKSQDELPAILQEVGDHVESFFRDFHNTISKEDVRQESLRRNGKTNLAMSSNYQYLLLTWPDSSKPALDEYRTESKRAQLPVGATPENFMLTRGFASTAFIFLPAYQKESEFLYLGRQAMDGHSTEVVAYAQRPETARLLVEFRAGETAVTTLSQGVVWIDRDTRQIIRIRTDLLFPATDVRLVRETTEIHYHEVNFKEASLSFWLPQDVTVTVDWKGKLFRNHHNYSDFHLFTAKSRIIATPDQATGP